jgi:hypothetical protein
MDQLLWDGGKFVPAGIHSPGPAGKPKSHADQDASPSATLGLSQRFAAARFVCRQVRENGAASVEFPPAGLRRKKI